MPAERRHEIRVAIGPNRASRRRRRSGARGGFGPWPLHHQPFFRKSGVIPTEVTRSSLFHVRVCSGSSAS